MLRCVLKDIRGRETIAPAPVRLSIDMDENVPADALYAVFPYTETAQITGISVYAEDRLVFNGIVDEEERIVEPDGAYLRIASRSLAALLLDNEARPCVYDHPSAALIYERYVKPFGIVCRDLDDAVYFGEQTVAKGASCWSVVKNFCAACYASVPRLSADGVLYLKGMQREETVHFGENGVRYLRISELQKRSEELSIVRVKTANPGGYALEVTNEDAVRRGIRRERYLNALLSDSPMRCADQMLQNGRRKAYALKLRCPGNLLGTVACAAVVSDKIIGERGGLAIGSLYYRLTADGAYTDVRLRRRNS